VSSFISSACRGQKTAASSRVLQFSFAAFRAIAHARAMWPMANAAAAFSPLQTFHDAPFGFAFFPTSASPFQELTKRIPCQIGNSPPISALLNLPALPLPGPAPAASIDLISKKQANFVEKTAGEN